EHPRTAAGEVPDRLQYVRGLTLLEPGRGAVQTFGRLVGDLGGHAGLAALGRHLVQLVGHRAKLARGLLLLDGGLVTDLPAGLAGQVARLARGLGYDLPGLVGGGLGDPAARFAGGLAGGRGLSPRDVRGRPAGLVSLELAGTGLARTWLV